VGRCGREYCSASWLPELKPVNLSVAKAQHLSLNPAQISGPCGRLLCCLHYEHDFYVESRRRFPKEGKVLRTSVGDEKVLSVDIFRDRVTLRAEGGAARTIPLAQLNAEVAGGGAAPAPAPEAAPATPTARPPRPPRPSRPAQPETRTAAPAPPAPGPAPEPAAGGAPRKRRRRNRKRRGGGGNAGGPAPGSSPVG